MEEKILYGNNYPIVEKEISKLGIILKLESKKETQKCPICGNESETTHEYCTKSLTRSLVI